MECTKLLAPLIPLIIANGFIIFLVIVFAFIYPRRTRHQEVLERMHKTFLTVFLREWWFWVTTPFIRLFIFLKLTPNALTIGSLFLSGISAWYYYRGDFAIAGWLLALNGVLDTLDGRLARMTNRVSRQGAFLDSCLDRYSDSVIFLALALFYKENTVMLLSCMGAIIGSQLVSYTKARGEAVGISTTIGLMQRAERVFLLCIVSAFNPFLTIVLTGYTIDPHLPMIVLIIVMAISTNITAVVRIVSVFKKLKTVNA